MYLVTLKSDPTKSVLHQKANDQLKYFKRYSVGKRLACAMNIFRDLFRHCKCPKLRIWRNWASSKFSKSRQNTRDRFEAISDLQNMRSVLHSAWEQATQSKFSRTTFEACQLAICFLSITDRVGSLAWATLYALCQLSSSTIPCVVLINNRQILS